MNGSAAADNGRMHEAIHTALVHAYPSYAALRQFALFKLSLNLATLGPEELSPAAYALVRAMNARGALAQLVESLRDDKQGKNPYVIAMLQQPGVVALLPAPSRQIPSPTLTQRPGRRALLGLGGALVIALGAISLVVARPRLKTAVVEIRGGEFTQGSTVDELTAAQAACRAATYAADACADAVFARERPERRVRVASFALDAHEVTHARFVAWLRSDRSVRYVDGDDTQHGRFADERGATLAVVRRDGHPIAGYTGLEAREGRAQVRTGYEALPVVMVTWTGADRFCRAEGHRLPTEAEWEFAARGPTRRTWPWGNDAPSSTGSVIDRGGAVPFAAVTLERAQRAQDVTPDGVFDLAGNVSEWVADAAATYQPCDGPCVNPRTDAGGANVMRVVRGGDWAHGADAARGAARAFLNADAVFPEVGFRCARDLPETH